MHSFLKLAVAKTLSLRPVVCLLFVLALPCAASSQTRIVNATVDTTKTGVPVSKNIYGQFLEHGGDQPAVNPGSDTYPFEVRAALSEDCKTLSVAVLNPSDAEQNIRIAINGIELASAGELCRIAPDSIDATVQVDKKPEVQVEEQTLGALPDTITVRPFSANIYSYPVK